MINGCGGWEYVAFLSVVKAERNCTSGDWYLYSTPVVITEPVRLCAINSTKKNPIILTKINSSYFYAEIIGIIYGLE